ncbi:MAG TPA: hypothetical protein VMZ26_07940 [Pyrinomonadaceae bacterium]|nr:hypothetical protein [Pyrinomonadaceae bacterium]
MKFDKGIAKKYRRSVEAAFEVMLEKGNAEHREIASLILDSGMHVRVKPVSQINASGVTGLIDSGDTNDRIEDERLNLHEAFDEIYIAIAEETIDTGGQRGCEGTFVHEGRHAYDFARTIESFSDADVNPLSLFDPTLYELEWEAHKTSGEYMLRVGADEYIEEGLQLLILGQEAERCFVNEEGIGCRLRDNYGLTPDANPGPRASELLGLKFRV